VRKTNSEPLTADAPNIAHGVLELKRIFFQQTVVRNFKGEVFIPHRIERFVLSVGLFSEDAREFYLEDPVNTVSSFYTF